MDYRDEAPEVIRDFLSYHEVVRGHSRKTIDEYYLDLRTFLRYLKQKRGLVPKSTPFEDIGIADVDLAFLGALTKTEVYDFMSFLGRDRVTNPQSREAEYGLSPASRARKLATLRSLYKYLTIKTGKLEKNPLDGFDSPKLRRSLPKYLTLEESQALLSSVGGRNPERDRCILTIFLNCGLRISELVGLNLGDVNENRLRVVGKGDRERIVYINQAVADAINAYLPFRRKYGTAATPALSVSERGERIARSTVHRLVKVHLGEAGLEQDGYSAHKLRHTAATLMLRNGVDVRTLQELLGHEHLNTTEIYTHIENTDLRMAAEANPLAKYKPEKG